MTENILSVPSLKYGWIRRMLAVPRRFTAAFVLSTLLFGWLCLADWESEDSPKSAVLARCLRQACWAILPAIVFWLIRNAILPLPYSVSQWPFHHPFSGIVAFSNCVIALIYFFFFTAGFAWIFMAKTPAPPESEKSG